MKSGEIQREVIFKFYSDNLSLLKENNFLPTVTPKFVGTYICPLCLEHFSPKDLDTSLPNFLTLEDAPPKSLGGKANVLTCKNCNNTCGYKIDFHLTERLRELDSRAFLPNTETKVKVKKDGQVFQGTLKIDMDGTMRMYQSKKNNHPGKLGDFIGTLEPGTEIQMDFEKSRVIPENLQYAILKTGYLLAFERFGYGFILNEFYDRVRQQLLHPDANTYPTEFWFMPPYPIEMCGVYFICDKGCEAILSMFPLKTDASNRIFATILPLIYPVEETIQRVNNKFDENGNIELELYPHFTSKEDYISGIISIKLMSKWITDRKNTFIS